MLELLVAFAIMAMSIGMSYRIAGGSARHVADVTQQQHAVWLAESILASRNSVTAKGWNEVGDSAGFEWQVHSEPYSSGLSAPQVVPLHEIRLTIHWVTGSRPGQIEWVTLLPERKPMNQELIR